VFLAKYLKGQEYFIKYHMQNLISLPGFDTGYPNSEPKWWGLWSPKFDCFVLVHWDFDILKTAKVLTGSKIVTHLVELDADLYKKNIIDNSCCQNWTVENPSLIEINNIHWKKITKCNVIKSNADSNESDIFQIQSWFIFILYCLKKIEKYTELDTGFIMAEEMFDLPKRKNIKKQLFQILFLNEDLKSAQKQVDQLFSNHA
jgi:hypothetical protein